MRAGLASVRSTLRSAIARIREAFHWLARSLDEVIVRPALEAELEQAILEFQVDDGDQVIQQINLEYASVFSKASSLLTHVSLMIAALSFFFASGGSSPILKTLILTNLLLYLMALLFILRVIRAPTFHEVDVEKRRALLGRELLASQKYLRIAHGWIAWLTILVLVILAAERFPRK